jgi:hypothetical protein
VQKTQCKLFLDAGNLERLRINAESLLSSKSLSTYEIDIQSRIVVQNFIKVVRAVQADNKYQLNHLPSKKALAKLPTIFF